MREPSTKLPRNQNWQGQLKLPYLLPVQCLSVSDSNLIDTLILKDLVINMPFLKIIICRDILETHFSMKELQPTLFFLTSNKIFFFFRKMCLQQASLTTGFYYIESLSLGSCAVMKKGKGFGFFLQANKEGEDSKFQPLHNQNQILIAKIEALCECYCFLCKLSGIYLFFITGD